jgi:8-oxo-dGTP pyrophosphatase MutT (NUDIX family)
MSSEESSKRAGKRASSKRGASARRAPAGRASAKRASKEDGREFSAGGVVVRDGQVIVIVPTRRAADGSRVLALPKGHVDPGEAPIEAAAREVREETGVVGEPVCELGESRYWYRRDGRTIGKRVAFYLFTYVEGNTEDHDDEVEEVHWMPLEEARDALSHQAERDMVVLAQDRLDKDDSLPG